jgi:hypothetical protein
MKIYLKHLLFLLIFSFQLISCDGNGISDIDDVVIPSQNVSFAQYIQPIFNYKCTNSGCHDSESRAANLDLTTWTGATSDPLIVSPRFPDNSKMVWAVEGNSGASIMPPPYGSVLPLTENQIEGLRTWIEEGAKAN